MEILRSLLSTRPSILHRKRLCMSPVPFPPPILIISEPEIYKENWSLFIPPLLTLLDDTSTPIRCRSLSLTHTFLSKLPPSLLVQSGLDSVFEDAIMPSLSWLPTLTPLEESLQILPLAYQALYTLCDVRYPAPLSPPDTSTTAISLIPQSTAAAKGKEQNTLKNHIKFLDKILRQGILSSYTHSSEHPQIVHVLVKELTTLIPKLGISSVKHLKDTLPLLSSILSDPFATSQPALLLSAVKCLQVLILNAWPRMRDEGNRGWVISVLVGAWKSCTSETEREGKGEMEELEEIKKEIGIAGRLLVRAVGDSVDFRTEVGPLMEIDAGLVRDVFGVTAAP